ncbi:MAG: pilus assembly protein PilZ [Bradyrhizobium sp.]|uniref:pilus assembly protein PilZ n=1 Tax=Bradyrhizobium sp. TaxID=376 RepID=UPI0025C5261C|nr:pilus assembly protein PilZ [Bradyrhizobium sp.]MBI5262921.1 pilus assembly protein PilZ [Bradyrhizobium sp.]
MTDRRRLPRDRVYYGGLLAYNARASTLGCLVRNFNELGARIELGAAEILPSEVDFVVERRQFACRARLVWRSQTAAGLRFCDPLEARSPIPLDWARKLRASERVNQQLRLRIEQLSSER